MSNEISDAALEYHRFPRPGKIEVTPIKPLATQRDLALAYSPGVAAACEVIAEDPNEAATVTSRANLVAVITNGTAVLGLGNIGPLASKPVMEGKGVLFKKFAGIDVFDIEIDQTDIEKFVDTVVSLEPTFGGVNLEDIKAPECFEIERKCKERMKIPVFHDDQHGTAIVAAAAVHNGLKYVKKNIEEVIVATSGAGAAGIACLNLLVSLGLKRENIYLCDSRGVVTTQRNVTDPGKKSFEQNTDKKTLADAVNGADIFLGLSAAGVLKPEMVASMAKNPLILAMANPTPEIMPDEAQAVRPDAIVCTGRSDFPNQVNNVLCFPFIFRGALDVGATTINEEMKVAVVHALGEITHVQPPEVVSRAYPGQNLQYGPEYLLPKPFDPRLISVISSAVAQAAMDSGVATRPIKDMETYRANLSTMVYRSGTLMQPIVAQAKQNPKRVIYSDGEELKILLSIEEIIQENLAIPMIVGRQEIVESLIRREKLSLVIGENITLIDPSQHDRYGDYFEFYMDKMALGEEAETSVHEMLISNPTVTAVIAVAIGDADAMICGTHGLFLNHLRHITDVVGRRSDVKEMSAMSALVTRSGTYFLADTYVKDEPTAEEIAETTLLAAAAMRNFSVEPRIALISHSNFGNVVTPTERKMHETLRLLKNHLNDEQVEHGGMLIDVVMSDNLRSEILMDSEVKGQANLMVFPNLDSANSAFNLAKILADGVAVGPILLGAAKPCHILTPSASVRRIVNMAALAVINAQALD